MAEALAVIGAIASCDQLFKSFTSLYKNLNRAYKVIRHASRDVEHVKDRAKIIGDLWMHFGETMKNAAKIDEFNVDLTRYKKLDKDLNKQAQVIIRKIKLILNVLQPLLTKRRPVSGMEKFRATFEWCMKSQEDIRLLYVEMELLTGYMKCFMQLVNLEIIIQMYKLNMSSATKASVATIENLIITQLEEIHQIKQIQQSIGGNRNTAVNNTNNQGNEQLLREMRTIFREHQHEVRRIFREEFSRVPNINSRNDSSSDPRGSSIFSPTTSPSSPSGPENGQAINPESNEMHGSSRDRPSSARRDILLSPKPEVSFVSTQEPISPAQPDTSAASPSTVEKEEAEGTRSQGIYMPTPLFGPPEARRRPGPGRGSTDRVYK